MNFPASRSVHRLAPRAAGFSIIELIVCAALLASTGAVAIRTHVASRRAIEESRNTNIALSAVKTSMEIALLQGKDALVANADDPWILESLDVEPGSDEPAGPDPESADSEGSPAKTVKGAVKDFLLGKKKQLTQTKKAKLTATVERLKKKAILFETANYTPGEEVPEVLDMTVVLEWANSIGGVSSIELVGAVR